MSCPRNGWSVDERCAARRGSGRGGGRRAAGCAFRARRAPGSAGRNPPADLHGPVRQRAPRHDGERRCLHLSEPDRPAPVAAGRRQHSEPESCRGGCPAEHQPGAERRAHGGGVHAGRTPERRRRGVAGAPGTHPHGGRDRRPGVVQRTGECARDGSRNAGVAVERDRRVVGTPLGHRGVARSAGGGTRRDQQAAGAKHRRGDRRPALLPRDRPAQPRRRGRDPVRTRAGRRAGPLRGSGRRQRAGHHRRTAARGSAGVVRPRSLGTHRGTLPERGRGNRAAQRQVDVATGTGGNGCGHATAGRDRLVAPGRAGASARNP